DSRRHAPLQGQDEEADRTDCGRGIAAHGEQTDERVEPHSLVGAWDFDEVVQEDREPPRPFGERLDRSGLFLAFVHRRSIHSWMSGQTVDVASRPKTRSRCPNGNSRYVLSVERLRTMARRTDSGGARLSSVPAMTKNGRSRASKA